MLSYGNFNSFSALWLKAWYIHIKWYEWLKNLFTIHIISLIIYKKYIFFLLSLKIKKNSVILFSKNNNV
jgi:hypothetical protein